MVSPLIALMHDQVAGLLEAGVKAAVLNSTLTCEEAATVEARLLAGDLDLLYVAPERLLTPRCLALLGARRHRAVRDRRGALRVAMGARFPPGIYRPVRARRALSGRAADRADRHRRRPHARGDRRPARLDDAPSFVASFDRPNIRYEIVDKQNAQTQLQAFIAERHPGDAGIVYCLSRAKVEDTAGGAEQGRHRGAALSRRPGRRHARAQPGPLHQRGRRRDRRHRRVRHGHRQARRALRRASRSAQEHRGLLPGDRPRRARRQAVRAPGWPMACRISCSSAA